MFWFSFEQPPSTFPHNLIILQKPKPEASVVKKFPSRLLLLPGRSTKSYWDLLCDLRSSQTVSIFEMYSIFRNQFSARDDNLFVFRSLGQWICPRSRVLSLGASSNLLDDQATRLNNKLLLNSLRSFTKLIERPENAGLSAKLRSNGILARGSVLSAILERLQKQSTLPLGLWTARKSLSARNWKTASFVQLLLHLWLHRRSDTFALAGLGSAVACQRSWKREETLSVY